MKRYTYVWACAALVLGSSFGGVQARGQDAAAIAGGQQPTQGRVIQSRLDRLTQELRLTSEQRSQVAAILKAEKAARKAVKVDTSLTDDVRKAKRREIAASHNAQIRELLDAEQRDAFDRTLQKRARKS